MFFLKLKAKRIQKLSEEIQELQKEFDRITQNIAGMRNLISDESPENQEQVYVHLKIFYKLTDDLYGNKEKQEKLIAKLRKMGVEC